MGAMTGAAEHTAKVSSGVAAVGAAGFFVGGLVLADGEPNWERDKEYFYF